MKVVQGAVLYMTAAASSAYQFAIGFFITEHFADQMDNRPEENARRKKADLSDSNFDK